MGQSVGAVCGVGFGCVGGVCLGSHVTGLYDQVLLY